MTKIITVLFIVFFSLGLYAQENSISGRIVDENNNPLSFVNVVIYKDGASSPTYGTTTAENGTFIFTSIVEETLTVTFSYVGFKDQSKSIKLLNDYNFGVVTLSKTTETLDETVVVTQKPKIEKHPDKLVFYVENTTLSTGSALNVLTKTPGVLVIQDNISIKNAATVIYINNKRVYLSNSEVISLLRNMDASALKKVEVITNPSSNFDAEGAAILNIVTSKAISIGYKGSVNATYEQATYAKFALATNHFYKNDWVSLYGNYSFSPRKEIKNQDDHIRFFNDDLSTKAFWDTDFERETVSNEHQLNFIADFTLDEKNSVSVTSNLISSPNKEFNNRVDAEMKNAQRQLDSTFVTQSELENDKSNFTVGIIYELLTGEKNNKLQIYTNGITYSETQTQHVNTQYFDPDQAFLNENDFKTRANQESDVFTGGIDFTPILEKGSLQSGLKYSNITTKSRLDFFDTQTDNPVFIEELSDNFEYKENIYAAYVQYSRDWKKWSVDAGLRAEYTDLEGNSRALGEINTSNYFEVFPTVSITRELHQDHVVSLSYARRISRPRYQSLNPFKYFLNENNYNGGNPNLKPSIDNKITASYALKNKWFIDVYYQEAKNSLSTLTFQDNENQTLRNIESNLIGDFQYSLDVSYASSLNAWWYTSVYTSSFYLENEFYAVESAPETYSNSTYGFFGQWYNDLTISSKKNISADVTMLYFSNYIFGSYTLKNQYSLSFSIRKSFWNDKGQLTVGVDDIFNTNNIPVTSRYYNQDNSYFSKPESRLFRIGFKYSFGNTDLRDNNRNTKAKEEKRLESN